MIMIKTHSVLIKYSKLSSNAKYIYCLASSHLICGTKYKSKLFLNENSFRFYSTEDKHKSNDFWSNYHKLLKSGSVLALIGTVGLFWFNTKGNYFNANQLDTKHMDNEFGLEIKGLKSYTAEEVAKHNEKSKGIWVSYRSGVYDITDYVDKHPAGDTILLGSGGALEPFWMLFAFHKEKGIMQLLEKYRIGNLDIKDRTEQKDTSDDPYANDPQRHPTLKLKSKKPFNAEPPQELLSQCFLTPNEIFFVRNHLPVPQINLNDYTLEIEGIGLRSAKCLTVEDIKCKFEKHSVIASIQCAGNRRNEMNDIKEVKGLEWGSAAIGNAKWSGARLIDVLKYCDLNFNDQNIKHIQFEGLDFDASSVPYGASVEAFRALNPNSDFLIAYEMNGQDIPPDHGYPLRLIAPGVAGARNVKWLSRIVVSDEESRCHWQRKDYKSFSPNIDWHNVDFNSAPSIQETPIQSAFCDPKDGQTVSVNKDKQTIKLKGYAYSGGGRKVIRVDVSADEGLNWITAELEQEDSPLNRTYSWTLWKADIPVQKGWKSGQKMQLICKATDSHYNSQPENVRHIWNFRGVVNNSWHRITVNLK